MRTFLIAICLLATAVAQTANPQAQKQTPQQTPAPAAKSQPPAAANAQQPQRVYVRADRLLDVRTGKYLNNGEVVIEGERIVSVGPATKREAAANERVVEVRGTLLPGLFDMHTHLTYEPSGFGYSALGISAPREALTGAKNARLTLEAGFTTARNLGAGDFTDIALREAIEAGDVPGPRLLTSGPSMGITGGHCDNNLLPYEFRDVATSPGVADGAAAVQRKVRELVKYGANTIKVCVTGGVLSRGTDPKMSQVTRDELQMLVSEAHRLGRTVAAHAHGGEGIVWASEAGVDSIEHGSYIDDAAIAAMKKNGTYLVPTLYLAEWFIENAEKAGVPDYAVRKGREIFPIARQNFQRAVQQGVKIAFGTDSAVYPHGLNNREFAVYVKLGMTPLQAIQSATIHAAELAKWSDRLGTLEQGKLADMIVVDGDPLQDITAMERVRLVMKGGRVVRHEGGK